MNETFQFVIDGKPFSFPTTDAPEFFLGGHEVVSNQQTDITFGQPWYEKGHATTIVFSEDEFQALKKGLESCVEKIVKEELGIQADHFELEKYHHFVRSNEEHYRVIVKTRNLFFHDFNFPINEVFQKFADFLGFELTEIDPHTGEPIYIIIRINRPQSNDFNPPHKDVYHFMDQENSYIPQFLNIWIPVCGVNGNTALPLVENSHRLEETKILRTRDGGKLGTNTYNVRMIKSWEGSNALKRSSVRDREALFFSSHLVHGLAVNEEDDLTRVSLEFRPFRK